MPAVQVRYPNSVFGFTAGDPTLYADNVSYFVANGTIAAGNVVIADTSVTTQLKVIKATASTDGHLVLGVASEAAVAGDVVAVSTAGTTVATSNTVVTIGDRVGPDGTTAGNAATVASTAAVTQIKDVSQAFGIALQTVTAGDTSVRVYVGTPGQ